MSDSWKSVFFSDNLFIILMSLGATFFTFSRSKKYYIPNIGMLCLNISYITHTHTHTLKHYAYIHVCMYTSIYSSGFYVSVNNYLYFDIIYLLHFFYYVFVSILCLINGTWRIYVGTWCILGMYHIIWVRYDSLFS